MDDQALVSYVQNTIRNKITAQSDLLIAYSGGIDSTVLLHALVMLKQQYQLDIKLRAIYIHHGISQNADDWAEHCRQQCRIWQIPCIVEYVTLALEQGNIEEQARIARYQAISQYLLANSALCTAQHLDDQSETFLLALKRGSGPMGLSGMPELSDKNGHLLLRPLLSITRQQIEQYAQQCNLTWIEDESNQDPHYDRNFLRLNVFPILNQRWPQFNQMVARSAELCYEQQQLLDELLLPIFLAQVDSQLNLFIPPLYDASLAKRNALLRMWFKQHQVVMPSRKQLDIIWQTVVLAKEDSNPQFILHNKQIRRYQDKLYLLPKYQNLLLTTLPWDLKHHLILPDNLGIISATNNSNNCCRLPTITESVTIRFQGKGSYNVVGRNGSRQIKKLWQEYGVAPWMRSRIPLIFYNETLITAVNLFVTEQGQGDDISYQIN